jgi:hypothetical protein
MDKTFDITIKKNIFQILFYLKMEFPHLLLSSFYWLLH